MKKVLKITAVIFILGIIIFGVINYFTKDELPPRTEDLQLPQISIPEKENAFYYFKQAVKNAYSPEEKKDLIFDIDEGKKWDFDFVSELLEKNKISFDYLEKGLKCSNSLIPEVTGFFRPPLPHGVLFISLARLGSIKALRFFRQGKEKEAFDEAIKMVKIGYMIENSRGVHLIHFVTGMAMKQIELRRLRKMVVNTTLPPELIATYIPQLHRFKANDEGLRNTFKQEYWFFSKMIDDLLEGKRDWVSLEKEERGYFKEILFKYSFQPNKTKRMFADSYRVLIENISKPYAEMKHFEFPASRGFLSTIALFLSPNATGKIIYKFTPPIYDNFLLRKCEEDLSMSVTELLLAMKCYKVKMKTLPASLNELVPEYIPEVPQDPFDGNPIRFSQSKRIIYSVGKDLKDSGGSVGHNWKEMEDPTFMIEF